MENIEQFASWFLKQQTLGFVPFLANIHRVQDVAAVTLYRCGQYQVQLFLAPPGTIIPEHTHPNVDSIEVYVGGEIRFTLHGKYLATPEEMVADGGPFNSPLLRGFTVKVSPNTLHGGCFGHGGGVFMSIQHWLNGVGPHCVAADYSGITMGQQHHDQVRYGKATVAPQLTWQDAAPLETQPPFTYWEQYARIPTCHSHA